MSMTTQIDMKYERIDYAMYGISLYGLHDRKWEIDEIREDCKDCPSASKYLEEQLNAHIVEKLRCVEELKRRIREGDDKYDC